MHNKENKDKIVSQILLSWYAAGQHEFCLRVWSYILLTVWLLPNNLLKAVCGFGRSLVAVACAVWCQMFQVCCGVYESTWKLCHSTNPHSLHPNQMVISDILGILKTLEHKAPLPCLFLAMLGVHLIVVMLIMKEQIPPSLNVLSTPFFTVWNINVFLIFQVVCLFVFHMPRNFWSW